MAGWTTTSWLDAAWADLTTIRNWYDAVEEKRTSFSSEPDHPWASRPSSTTDLQSHLFWSALQQWIEDECIHFVRSHELSGPIRTSGTDFLDTLTTPLTSHMWTFTDLMLSVSLGEAIAGERHFRRVPGGTMPADWTDWDDPAYEYGRVQKGDTKGPWLFKDLQDTLNRMIWTWSGHYNEKFAAKDGEWDFNYDSGGSAGDTHNLQKNWGVDAWKTTRDLAIAGTGALSDSYVAEGPIRTTSLIESGGWWWASAWAIESKYELQTNAFSLSATPEATFYAAFEAVESGIWSDQGTGISENEWVKDPTKIDIDSLPKVSNLSFLTPSTTEPTVYIVSGAGGRGMIVKDIGDTTTYDRCGAILDWNKVGGYDFRP